MSLQCDVTKKNREDFSVPPREGAYVHGLYMEGARWDTQVHESFIDFFVQLNVREVANSWFWRIVSREGVDAKSKTAHFSSQAPLQTTSNNGW